MFKYLYKILFIFVLIVISINTITYGANQKDFFKEFNTKTIATWYPDFTVERSTDERMAEWRNELISKINSSVNCGSGINTITKTMILDSKICIVKEGSDSKKYKIRIRK